MNMLDPDTRSRHEAEADDAETVATGNAAPGRVRLLLRGAAALLVLLLAVIVECVVMVPADQAMVVSRFGDPVRVLTEPGLSWKLPAPIETTIPIDLRLRTTSTGLQDVGTRDGLRVLVQVFAAWRVPADPAAIRQFLRAVRNEPDEAARQLRGFIGAGMHITSSTFNLSDLVNSDAGSVRIDRFEHQLAEQIAPQMLQGYGIEVRQVGVERLTLPDVTLAATVARMSAERETVAAIRTADGLRRAAKIQADADRDGRETVADARREAARIEGDAEIAAARIYAAAYSTDPGLYTTLRSLDTVGRIAGANTTLVLGTDSAPFRVLAEGPAPAAATPAAPAARGPVAAPAAAPAAASGARRP